MIKIQREEVILQAAIRLAMNHGLRSATRKEVAAEAGCTDRLINYYFGTVEGLWDAVLNRACAVPSRYLVILGQAVASGDKRVVALSDGMKLKALSALAASART